ncbi:MAG TPA: dimethylargininase [Thermoanaerobaculia bacterium]|nr:dimethylargininase [Thermoanaerobaculia bacterium]
MNNSAHEHRHHSRAVAGDFPLRAELHPERQPIDFARAARQHHVYEQRLAAHGCTIVHVADAPEMPDAVFVEDAAVVTTNIAFVTRPGAESRRGETESMAEVLKRYRPVRRVAAPATVDGGDVLRIGEELFAGISQRTNAEGVRQLGATPIDFAGCLHLKSAVTEIGDRMLLVNPKWVDPRQFPDCDVVETDPREPFAGNALRLGRILIYSASYPRTLRRLELRGFQVEVIDVSELEKAEAGVTCCSVIFDD